ncbi:MAG TPA: aminotransferase class I/II-fold pyridoxal phosphate-dependent enzyme [Steroidobacteraceae bacterium]
MTGTFSRRQMMLAVMAASAAGASLRSIDVSAQSAPNDRRRATVNFVADGLMLSPADYVERLNALVREGRIAPDDYSCGGVVETLEQAFAQLLGKEAAIFMPTGTLANHLALRALCERGSRVLVQEQSHLYNDSGDCAQTLSQLTLIPLGHEAVSFTLEDVQRELDRLESQRVFTRVAAISIESPVRRRSNAMFPLEELRRISQFAREQGIRLHLDGARLLIASAYTRVPPGEYAAMFDTVYVSLYKGLNGASGAILAGPKDVLDGMQHIRRMFGAGLPAAWPFAAIPLVELPGFQKRLQEAIAVSEAFLQILEADGRVRVERVANGTNVVRLGNIGSDSLQDRLKNEGILIRRVDRQRRELTLTVNESWRERPAEELARNFLNALA